MRSVNLDRVKASLHSSLGCGGEGQGSCSTPQVTSLDSQHHMVISWVRRGHITEKDMAIQLPEIEEQGEAFR